MMNYTAEEVIQFAAEEDVKFIRIAFTDLYGRQKNVSIMPHELPRAFKTGIAIDASALPGLTDAAHSDVFLKPDPATLSLLPWRPDRGRVVRMYSDLVNPDGSFSDNDTRHLLREAEAYAASKGYLFTFGSEMEFYLLKLDENGERSEIPHDQASYMDIAPLDRGENVRREICLTLEQMGILPESSHHEEGPGQNEIDFRYAEALKAADDAITFRNVVSIAAERNGLAADFSPKPLRGKPGNGFHMNMSVRADRPAAELLPAMTAGILRRISEITLFLNPDEQSYLRLGSQKAPGYVSWSRENRSQLIRIPAAEGEYVRLELRSPDAAANPYLAFTLLIYAALEGLEEGLVPPAPADLNLYTAGPEITSALEKLPGSLTEARRLAAESEFVRSHLPAGILRKYLE